MRIAIVGAGGVGGYFGVRFAQRGHDVVFVARGDHLAALEKDGIRLFSPKGDAHLPAVEATPDGDVAPADLIVVSVKTWQLEEVIGLIERLQHKETLILPLLNGVTAPARLGSRFGATRVLGGYCNIISAVEGPGVIRHRGVDPQLFLGPMSDDTNGSSTETLPRLLDGPGLDCFYQSDVEVGLWKKFIFVATWGGVGAISNAPIGATRSVPESRELLLDVMRELIALGRAHGIGLPSDTLESTMAYMDTLPAAGTTSMQRDFHDGRRSELYDLTGAAVRLAESVGCAVPLNRAIYAALLPRERMACGQDVAGLSSGD